MLCGITSVCICFCRNTRMSDMCFLTPAHSVGLLREKLTVWFRSYFPADTENQTEQKVQKSLVHLWVLFLTVCWVMRCLGGRATIFHLLIKKTNLNNVALNFQFRTLVFGFGLLLVFFFPPSREVYCALVPECFVRAGFLIMEAHLYSFSASNYVFFSNQNKMASAGPRFLLPSPTHRHSGLW